MFPRAIWQPDTGGGDPLWDDVVFLANYDASSPFIDYSPLANTITTRSTATASAAQTVFGPNSLNATGSFLTPACLTLDSVTSLLIPATDPFCIETFIYPTSLGTPADQCFLAQWTTITPNLMWSFWATGTGGKKLTFYVSEDGTTPIGYADAADLADNTWYYCCFDWDGSKYRLFKGTIGGNASMVASSSTARTITSATAAFTIMCHSNRDSAFFQGYQDETRITNASRHGSDSNFPVPTEAFPLFGT